MPSNKTINTVSNQTIHIVNTMHYTSAYCSNSFYDMPMYGINADDSMTVIGGGTENTNSVANYDYVIVPNQSATTRNVTFS